MDHPQTLSVTERFSLSMDGLRKAVAARIAGGWMTAAMIMLVWSRLRRIESRVLALVAAIRAGRVWPVGAVAKRGDVMPNARAAPGPGAVRNASAGLPRGFAWLVKLVPYEAAGFASQLRCVLEEPEMRELLAATPRLGKALRPLCRMLGLAVELVVPVLPAAQVELMPADAQVGAEKVPCLADGRPVAFGGGRFVSAPVRRVMRSGAGRCIFGSA